MIKLGYILETDLLQEWTMLSQGTSVISQQTSAESHYEASPWIWDGPSSVTLVQAAHIKLLT